MKTFVDVDLARKITSINDENTQVMHCDCHTSLVFLFVSHDSAYGRWT